MAESNIIRFTKQQETKNICQDRLWKKQDRNLDLQLKLLETRMSK